MPATSVVFGNETASVLGNDYAYRASNQRLDFFGNLTNGYELAYSDLGGQRGSPKSHGNWQPTIESKPCLPLVTTSLPPHLVDAARTDWADYFDVPSAPTNIPAFPAISDQRVGMGFNISAPLTGRNYYLAPTHFINEGSTVPADEYPQLDGYHNYDASQAGLHAGQAV